MKMWRALGYDYLKSNNIILQEKDAQEMTTMSLKMSSTFIKERFKLEKSSETIYDEMKDIARNFYKNDCLLKIGAREILQDFKNMNYKMLLGTGTPHEFLEPFLEREDLYKYFSDIITCDGIGIKKDNPNFFLFCSEKLNSNPKDVTLIDDAFFALKAAKTLGMKTIGVYDEVNKNVLDILKSVSDQFVYNLSDIKL
ncbi:HAD superfamily hydrolase (TIGR01509 family) [Peptoniphilus koenoeneniae]|jgi:hypothetical protein|uniref:HAD superfamily hydrolase (TIGR01509 family) n=2 Tax=Peptoniphilaceae TaxID=1570339 RepID=A0ABU0AUS5_9FIRM|nr:haloacid dehalogenase-like hydrolase [Peptoniphilus sp. BV3C26]MDQ0274609.1 HAD superfamily hydrolase (TIGR01509 family) [Peptoniphilus koenoeneniae]